MNTQKYKELDFYSFQLAKKEVQRVGQIEIKIVGKSMYPLYEEIEGQKIIVHYVKDIKELKRFDVITFWLNNILVTHYVWKQNEVFIDDPNDPILVTRPLNPMKSFDTPIKFSQVLGIVPERKISLWLKFRIYLNYFWSK